MFRTFFTVNVTLAVVAVELFYRLFFLGVLNVIPPFRTYNTVPTYLFCNQKSNN